MNDTTDAELVAAVPTGGLVGEFEAVYRAEFGRVTAFFARRERDPQAVADLTADTFVAAMTSFGAFDPGRGTARSWVFAIARRVYAQHCELDVRRRDAARRDAGRRVLDADQVEELVRRIDAERAGRVLLARLTGLPLVERTAVELVDLVGLTPKEAAGVLGVSPGALRVRLFRARARLRKDNDDEERTDGDL
jgi:RNA polymerase sigma factor (sigma-70 family)